MKYYLITTQELNENHSDCEHAPAYSVDGTKCILEAEDGEVVENYIMFFENTNAVNDFRYSEAEAVNWIPANEF